MMVYNQIALGNDYSFEIRENYQIIADNDKQQTATTTVYNSLELPQGTELPEDNRNYGIVAYSKTQPVYVAIELERGSFTQEQVGQIAKSLSFSFGE
jgi:hypothetical protein